MPIVRAGSIAALALTVILAAIPGDNGERSDAESEAPPLAGSGVELLAAVPETLAARGALARIEAALRAPHFELAADGAGSAGRRAASLRLVELAHEHALAQQAAGDGEAAFETALILLQLGQRIQLAAGELADWHWGAAVQIRGVACLHALLRDARLAPRRAAHLIDRLGACRSDRAALRRTYAGSERALAQRLDELAEGRLDPIALGLVVPSELPVDWRFTRLDVPATRQTLARAFARAQRGIEVNSVARWQEVAAQLEADRQALVQLADARNLVGTRLCRSVLGATIAAPLRQARMQDTMLDAVRTLIALNAHRTRKGSLPRSLDALGAFFAGRPPLDAFADAPLRYDPDRHRLWSIGVDQRDSGGSAAPDADKARADVDEPTFWIEF